MKKKRVSNLPVKKECWNIQDDHDWTKYRQQVLDSVHLVDKSSVDNLASSLSASILKALHDTVGLKSRVFRSKPRLLPPALVQELVLQRQLEKNWKTMNSENANCVNEEVSRAEALFLQQKEKASDLLLLHRQMKRKNILEKCKGTSVRARKNFWSHFSPSQKQSSDISAVVDPVSGVVKCNSDEIIAEVEVHLTSVFEGSSERIVKPVCVNPDHVYAKKPQPSVPGSLPDHTYSVNPSPCLPHHRSDASLGGDPTGWMNCDFEPKEVQKILKQLKTCKAKGWDLIPNEALKNLPDEMVSVLCLLFNKIKNSGVLPNGWNRGRITLVHKRGLREVLGNYRPITVLISLSGLYSKVLNDRLSQVVEEHKLLEEVHNGFCKERGGPDNNFILDTFI